MLDAPVIKNDKELDLTDALIRKYSPTESSIVKPNDQSAPKFVAIASIQYHRSFVSYPFES